MSPFWRGELGFLGLIVSYVAMVYCAAWVHDWRERRRNKRKDEDEHAD